MDKNLIKRLLKENITLEYHDELNPKLWDNQILKSDVRFKLLNFAKIFIKSAKLNTSLIKDVIITGGNVNFNYTKYSDIDVHVLVDISNIKNVEGFEELMDDKKKLWILKHDNISIKGYKVEPYVQNINEKIPGEQGIYSLITNEWKQKPQFHKDLDFNQNNKLEQKADKFEHIIRNMIDTNVDIDKIDKFRNYLKNMRSEGIKINGEFSFENLLFKELRNRGLLDKINEYKNNIVDKELSLEDAPVNNTFGISTPTLPFKNRLKEEKMKTFKEFIYESENTEPYNQEQIVSKNAQTQANKTKEQWVIYKTPKGTLNTTRRSVWDDFSLATKNKNIVIRIVSPKQSTETNSSHKTETNPSHKTETNPSHKTETNPSHKDGNKLKLADAWNERNRLHAEAYKLNVEGDKAYEEGTNYAKGDMLYAKSEKLYDKADEIWKKAIKKEYGKNIEVKYENKNAILPNGDTYHYKSPY